MLNLHKEHTKAQILKDLKKIETQQKLWYPLKKRVLIDK